MTPQDGLQDQMLTTWQRCWRLAGLHTSSVTFLHTGLGRAKGLEVGMMGGVPNRVSPDLRVAR